MNDRGSVLILALLIMLLTCTIVMGLLQEAMVERTISHSMMEEAYLYYLAEGGLNLALLQLQKDPDWRPDNHSFAWETGGVVELSHVYEEEYLLLESRASLGNRAVILQGCIDWEVGSDLIKEPLFAQGDTHLYLPENSFIEGLYTGTDLFVEGPSTATLETGQILQAGNIVFLQDHFPSAMEEKFFSGAPWKPFPLVDWISLEEKARQEGTFFKGTQMNPDFDFQEHTVYYIQGDLNLTDSSGSFQGQEGLVAVEGSAYLEQSCPGSDQMVFFLVRGFLEILDTQGCWYGILYSEEKMQLDGVHGITGFVMSGDSLAVKGAESILSKEIENELSNYAIWRKTVPSVQWRKVLD